MALNLTQEADNLGVSGNYHRILQINTNFNSNDVKTDIVMYASQEARQSNKNTLGATFSECLGNRFLDRVINVGGNGMTMRELILEQAYLAVKEWAQEEAAKPDIVTVGDKEVPNPDKNFKIAKLAQSTDC